MTSKVSVTSYVCQCCGIWKTLFTGIIQSLWLLQYFFHLLFHIVPWALRAGMVEDVPFFIPSRHALLALDIFHVLDFGYCKMCHHISLFFLQFSSGTWEYHTFTGLLTSRKPPLVKYLQRTLDQSLILLLVYCCVLRGFHIFQIITKYPIYLFHQSGSFHSFLWHVFQDKIEICLFICFHAHAFDAYLQVTDVSNIL